MTQKLKQLDPEDIINGFSFSFTLTLLNTLKKACDDETLFSNPIRGTDCFATPNHLIPVITYLEEQVQFSRTGVTTIQREEIKELIVTAEKFLAIFE